MNLVDYTVEGGFLVREPAVDLSDAVARLVGGLAAAGDVTDPDGLVAEVMRREKAGSTAIGGGVVIPHARYAGVNQLRVAVATLAAPLDVHVDDDVAVDVVILLVGPAHDPRQMLRVLARLARLVRREEFLSNLRRATDPAAMRTALVNED